mgnify:CR=1 FL=1
MAASAVIPVLALEAGWQLRWLQGLGSEDWGLMASRWVERMMVFMVVGSWLSLGPRRRLGIARSGNVLGSYAQGRFYWSVMLLEAAVDR